MQGVVKLSSFIIKIIVTNKASPCQVTTCMTGFTTDARA